jgi:hypothetical protein
MRLSGYLSVFLLWSGTSLAAPSVSLIDVDGNPQIKIDADQEKLAVFTKNKSLWVVSTGNEPIDLNIPADLRKKFNIEAGEALKVNGGAGGRIQFSDNVPSNIDIVDTLDKSTPMSVIGLSEGLILSGATNSKVLVAQSVLTQESFSAIPFGGRIGQVEKEYLDGSKTLKTYAGYAFEAPEGGALNTLYRGRQQFLAQNKERLISLAKKAPKQETVFSTREPQVQDTPIQSIAPVRKVDVEQTLTVPVIEQIQPTEVLASLPALKTPQAETQDIIQNDEVDAINPLNQNAPLSENRFQNALMNIQQATQRLQQIKIPEKENIIAEKAIIQDELDLQKIEKIIKVNETVDNFSSFFGEDIAEKDDFTREEKESKTVITSQNVVTSVEEAPVVDIAEDTVSFAMNILDDANAVDEKSQQVESENINTYDFDDEEFKIPDLDVNEPIFKRYGDGSEEDYLRYKQGLLDALALAPSQIKRQQYRLRLAKLYMSYERPYEVLMMMDNMPKDEDDQIMDTSSRILSGASNVMINRPEDAIDFLEIESENFEDDRKLWLAAAYELSDKDSEALELYENYIEVSDNYPKRLIKELYTSYGRLLLRQERLSDLKNLMKEMTLKMRQSTLPPEALMLLAKSAIIERNDPLAETLLSQVAASDNVEVSFLAQYEFVSFLLGRGDLGVNQAIEHLENLRYLWRGDFVEQEILKKLGYMYINRGEQRKGLERLKYHNIYYPNTENQEAITELMMTAFTDLYLDETALSQLDPLALLGLYYDYRELTPSGEKGDKLIAQIGDRLRNLGLFERAADVLERQLKFRVKEDAVKGEMGRNLAQIYYLDSKFNESLNALVRTESPDLDDDITKSRQYIEVENYIELGEFSKATKLLKGMDEERATKLIAQIGWIQGEYQNVVQAYEKIYDDPKNLPMAWKEEEKLNFVRLAVAYNNLGRLRDLENLTKRYQRNLREDDKIVQAVNFLMKDQGSDIVQSTKDPKSLWESVNNSLSAYYDFANYYDDFVADRETDKRDKDIFNRRMRQMSAPPRY